MAQGKVWNRDEVLSILEPYFRLGYSVAKACEYAGIARTTVQTWIEDDEELRLKVTGLQNEINAKARKVIQKSIDEGDKDMARWWAERREKDSFSIRQENINTNITVDELIKKFESPDGEEKDETTL